MAKLYPEQKEMLTGAAHTESSKIPGMPPLPAVESNLEAAQHWYAVCVYPRHEKAVRTYLDRRGVHAFVPLYRTIRRWKDRKKELELVLFPGYVFVSLDLQQRLRVLESPSVVRFVCFQGRPAPIRESEIQSLLAGLAVGIRVEPHPYIREGKRVRVVRGALAGTEGIMKRRKDRFRLVLSIDLIMRSVMLEVEEADVEPF